MKIGSSIGYLACKLKDVNFNRIKNCLATFAWVFLIALQTYAFPVNTMTQHWDDEYEEIAVFVRIPRIGGFEIQAVFSYETEKLYLPVTDLFNYLKINNRPSADQTLINGFLIDESKQYSIRYDDRVITVQGVTYKLPDDALLRTDFGLFLVTDWFGRAFGLHCNFNFRSLSVEINTDMELPAVREMRLAQMRKNLERLRGEVAVDTTYLRNYHFFKPGMIEWNVLGSQSNATDDDYRFSLGLGTELLAGEASAYFLYSTRDGFDWRNQQYQWRYVNNHNRFVRQIQVGKLRSATISSIYEPVHSAVITNRSTGYRSSFGYFTWSDHTEPDWTVEVYINNVLVDYTRADASGFFSFEIPLIYGTSEVVLKFYGPYGEERMEERVIDIPFNFLPAGEVEYVITGGMVQDGNDSRLARAEVNAGLSRFMTVGGGVEYFSQLQNTPFIPFFNTSVVPLPGLMFNGEYAHDVRTRLILNYRLGSMATISLDYSLYSEEQEAVVFNYLEERRAVITFPVRMRNFRLLNRAGIRQNVYEQLTYNSLEWVISGNYRILSANLATHFNWLSERQPYIVSNFGLSLRLPAGYTLRTTTQYDWENHTVLSVRAEMEKRIRNRGAVTAMFEENLRVALRSVSLGFRYDLSFSQINASVRYGNTGEWFTAQAARGSIALGSGNRVIHTDNRGVIGRGGLSIIPFLDVNHNGVRDEGEPLVKGLGVRLNGGRLLRKYEDGIIRIAELEPYASYLLELDDIGLENIAWRIDNKVLSIEIDPNQFKRVYIPVLPMGEVNGMVYLETEQSMRGLGRIQVHFTRIEDEFSRSVLSESDGFITYLGLPPGKYRATIDAEQLERLSMSSYPEYVEFEIEALEIGDIVDDIEFTLTRVSSE